MRIEVVVPDYSPEGSLRLSREANSKVSSRIEATQDEVVITGNPEGFRTLGTVLLALAGPTVPSHYHVHLDQDNGWLVPGSVHLVIEVIKDDLHEGSADNA